MEQAANKVEGQSDNKGAIVEIHGTTLREGIESKYEFSLVKCNRGGYIAIRGNDVGAYPNIDEALDFLRKDIKLFMHEPLTAPPEIPRTVSPAPIHGIERLQRHVLDEIRRPIVANAATMEERRWSYGEILGMATVFVLLVILAFQGTRMWWPELL